MPDVVDYAGLVQQAAEAAAARLRRGARPPPRLAPVEAGSGFVDRNAPPELLPQETVGQMAGRAGQAAADVLLPQTPLGLGMYAIGGPFGPLTKTALLALGAALQPGEAQAGGAEKLAKLGGTLFEKARQAGLMQYPSTGLQRIRALTQPEPIGKGGYTVHLGTGEVPTSGLMVGTYRNADPRTLVLPQGPPSYTDIIQHALENRAALARPEKYLGTWTDPDTGKVYLDVSRRFDPEMIRQATKFGERTGQLSGYNIGAGAGFPIGNWRQFIDDPEYAARLMQLAGEGRQFLSTQPNPVWWDTPTMLGVYGAERRPQLAGFTAATAPNAAPRENVQTMSEYMRRLIRGEPIVQPDWRMPAGTMSRQEGSMIGMEAARTGNLERAALGQPLSGMKVGQEQAALMGDPRAVVIDRHLVRAGEAPERGIYASGEEGDIGSAANYQHQMEATRRTADAVGIDPRDFSAQAWTGARESIRNTSQLFGTPYRGAAVPGESKSYDDHFVDLLNDKADHLGMKRSELEKRLAGGDATLLSAVLGTPAIAEMLKGAGYQLPSISGSTEQPSMSAF